MRRRAVLSVRANPACPDQAAAEKAVNEVWESCFNDTRPFDEVRREAFMMQDLIASLGYGMLVGIKHDWLLADQTFDMHRGIRNIERQASGTY